MDQATALLQDSFTDAVKVLKSIMLNKKISPTPRIGAARSILDFGSRASELENLLRRVEELERKQK